MQFQDFGLLPALLRAIDAQGYSVPTPIQANAIPLMLDGHDLMASAPTGTGKTAAFALPMLQRLFADDGSVAERGRHPRALVLAPTRELAAQVHASVRSCATGLGLRSVAIFGGVKMQGQVRALQRGVDLVVATPGRLIDHMQRGTIDLRHVDMLVLDEADRMLDMGFLPALRTILAKLPQERQTVLFSATFDGPIKTLARQFLRDPEMVNVAPPNVVTATVTHRMHPVDASRKRDALLHILAEDSRRQTLVFSRTKHGANKLVKFLQDAGLKAAAIHGNKSQNQRTRALREFKNHKVTVLVATDIAARGLDIEQLPLVVNQDLPMVATDYVHRIGRTGRAGADGLAISLVSQEEAGLLRDIRKLLGDAIEVTPLPGYEPAQPLQYDRDDRPGRKSRAGRSRPARKPGRRHETAGKRGARTRAGQRPAGGDVRSRTNAGGRTHRSPRRSDGRKAA